MHGVGLIKSLSKHNRDWPDCWEEAVELGSVRDDVAELADKVMSSTGTLLLPPRSNTDFSKGISDTVPPAIKIPPCITVTLRSDVDTKGLFIDAAG